MARSPVFDPDTIAALDRAKILGVRSGTEHRYTGVWPVVVEGRLFVRSWNDKPTGWYRAFRAEPRGSVRLSSREIPVRAVHVRSTRLREAVSDAFAQKYDIVFGATLWIAAGLALAIDARRMHAVEMDPAMQMAAARQ